MDKTRVSPEWRRIGEQAAFLPHAWRSQSLYYYYASERLLESFRTPAPTLADVGCLIVSGFSAAMALELIAKAYYLAAKAGPREAIYKHKHEAARLLPNGLLDAKQAELMARAHLKVKWASRYPTPVWTKEGNKAEFDAPLLSDGTVDGAKIPNTTGIDEINEMLALYEHLHAALRALGENGEGHTGRP